MKSQDSSIEEGESLLTPKERLSSDRKVTSAQRSLLIILSTTALLLAFGVGVWSGRNLGAGQDNFGLPIPPGSIQIKWQHNLTFTQKPDIESEAVWSSIIPVGRGFVHHPQLAPYISNIAVFHQLHCLHAVYVAYYDALESPAILNLTDVLDFDDNTGTRIAVSHVRHCIDYIRQALMCAADTNLEVLDPKTHATNGWNQTKQCRSYEDIRVWAERYANSSDTGIIT